MNLSQVQIKFEFTKWFKRKIHQLINFASHHDISVKFYDFSLENEKINYSSRYLYTRKFRPSVKTLTNIEIYSTTVAWRHVICLIWRNIFLDFCFLLKVIRSNLANVQHKLDNVNMLKIICRDIRAVKVFALILVHPFVLYPCKHD